MAVRIDKMRKAYEAQKRGGDFWTPDVGDTKVYIHPPCRSEDTFDLTSELNYIPVGVHYGIGKNGAMAVCLDPEANPILNHPYLRPFLKKKGVKLEGKCPVCRDINTGGMSPDEANDARLQTRYMWGVTPLAFRASPSDEWRKLPPKPSVAMVGKTLYEGFVQLFDDAGDVSDITGATLARVNREGKGKNDTKYKVTADAETTKVPINVKEARPKLSAALDKALADSGDCDLFRVVAGMIKGASEIKAMLSGVKTEESDDDEEEAEEAETKGRDDEEELDKASEDEEDDEAAVPAKKPAAKVKPKAAPVEEEEAEATEDEEEAPPPKVKAKVKPKVDEEEEAEASDEEEEAPPAKAKAKAKPAPEPEEEEEAEASDEEEAPPAKKPAAKPAASEEDGLDELDAELDRLSKKKAKK